MGSVLGVDIGWSRKRRTTGVCRLDLGLTAIKFECTRATLSERPDVLKRAAGQPLLVAAFDGPLRGDRKIIGQYRVAEQMLTRQLGQLIGKPGQSNSPAGERLNFHASERVKVILQTEQLLDSKHDHAMHKAAIVEAFPSSFLGVLIEDPDKLETNRSNRWDALYEHLDRSGGLIKLLTHLLPGRKLETPFNLVNNHDERAAVVCAMTALCIAVGNYSVVRDKDDDWNCVAAPLRHSTVGGKDVDGEREEWRLRVAA